MVPAPASAITYGDFVDSPHIQYPEVVPVWVAGALCTGTLIEQQIVLTAAHCVYGRSGPIQIAVGGSTLNSGRLIDVTATWYHPRYDASFLQNDIGLLHLKEPAGVSRLASLPSPRANKPKNLTLAGWGDDQNGRLTGNLSVLNLNEQGSAASKAFRGLYNPRTMIGAGRFFPNEALYGGGCEGDSGGPLYKGRNGSTRVLIGVTSWGAEGCVQYKPTIFTLVSYYVPELLTAISQVKNRAIQSPLPTGKATPVGLGPTTTTTTTTTTIRPTTTTTRSTNTTSSTTTTAISTPTTIATTTTSRAIANLNISVAHRLKNTSDPPGIELEIRISTDPSALPSRLCVYLNQQGGLWSWYNAWGDGNWRDLGGRCVSFTGARDSTGTYYYRPEIQDRAGDQRWSVAVDISDSLGRFKTSSWYEWIS
jgi:secreted trypsin-like serine protease